MKLAGRRCGKSLPGRGNTYTGLGVSCKHSDHPSLHHSPALTHCVTLGEWLRLSRSHSLICKTGIAKMSTSWNHCKDSVNYSMPSWFFLSCSDLNKIKIHLSRL